MESPVSLVNPLKRRSLREWMLDEERMLTFFRRQLPAMAKLPLRVSHCRVRPSSRHIGHRSGRTRVVYRVTVEAARESRWEHTVIATAPVSPDFLGPELLHLSRNATSHPAAEPFTELAAYIEDLEMALLLLPVDPALPGLAEITGRERGLLMARHIPECHEGAVIRRADWRLRRYVPARRCELAMKIGLEARGRVTERDLHVHIFSDDRGQLHHENLEKLWPLSRESEHLRIPQPLGYDADQRLLFTTYAGTRAPGRWIRRLERDATLPVAVDRLRVQQCVAAAARSLVDLQRADVSPSEEYTFRGELAPLHRGADLLRSAYADSAGDYGRLLELLSAQPIDEETLVPAHGRFGPNRLAGDERSLVILDWDRLCLASPALDAANFLGRLRCCRLCKPHPGEQAEHLASVFRREFMSRDPVVTERELAAYESLVLARQAIRVARLSGRRSGTAARRVQRLIEAALDRIEVGEAQAIAG